MKKYYLIAEGKAPVRVRVSDALGPGRTVLLELEAASYAEAVKLVCFSASSMGKTAVCGVAANGDPYAEVV